MDKAEENTFGVFLILIFGFIFSHGLFLDSLPRVMAIGAGLAFIFLIIQIFYFAEKRNNQVRLIEIKKMMVEV